MKYRRSRVPTTKFAIMPKFPESCMLEFVLKKPWNQKEKGKTLMGIQAEGIAYGKQRKPGII